jgi:long-chain acyl-CoA synthetase
MKNLAAAFLSSVEKNSAKTAVFYGEEEYSYNRLAAMSRWLAWRLQSSLGLRPGDRAALWLKNCPEYIPGLYGILEAGGVAVPINNFLKPDEVNYILGDADINVLITDHSQPDAVQQLIARRPGLRVFHVEEFAGADLAAAGGFQPVPRGERDLAIIIYTSGTTGHPKGAMLSHGNLLHNVESCRVMLMAVDGDRFVLLLPMFHSYMVCVCILLPLTVGGSIVLIKALNQPRSIMHEIISRQASILPAIPQFFRTLAAGEAPPNLPLRVCISGAAPLPVEVLKEFNRKYPVTLIEGYGLSEASPVVAFNPIQGPQKGGSIGVPIPNVEMSIQNDAGEFLPDNEVGEICVRGGNVMQGYWNQPEETAKAMRGDWLLTGDIGFRDADGYYVITDRKKDMLLVNGINVYPREIDEVIHQYPGIKEAAVIGKPDARKGEQPIAFVAMLKIGRAHV